MVRATGMVTGMVRATARVKGRAMAFVAGMEMVKATAALKATARGTERETVMKAERASAGEARVAPGRLTTGTG